MANAHASINQYEPDIVSSPGETLQEILEERGITQAELAERTGRPKKTINELIKAKASLTHDTALQLERVLGIPASFWNNLESNYRASLAAQRDREALERQISWLKGFPINRLIDLGWIARRESKTDQVRELLSFFGIASDVQWNEVYGRPQVSFRRSASFETSPMSLSCWLRRGAIQAERLTCSEFDRERFRDALRTARTLVTEPIGTAGNMLTEICCDAGVAVVIVPELPMCPTSGATYWTTSNKAVIQLSLRHRTDDQFWFSFFHEAGHILLHGKRLVFIEGEEFEGTEEDEANSFAADVLIPPSLYKRLRKTRKFSKETIRHFASSIGLSPGIVVGRLQHDGVIPHSHCNDLKRKYNWTDLTEVSH